MELVFLFYLFVCVVSLATADSSGTCEVLCIAIIGIIIAGLVLSVPFVIVVYFTTKLVMRLVHNCLLKRQMRKNGPRLSIYELGETARRASQSREVRNSTTILEMIEELPENQT